MISQHLFAAALMYDTAKADLEALVIATFVIHGTGSELDQMSCVRRQSVTIKERVRNARFVGRHCLHRTLEAS